MDFAPLDLRFGEYETKPQEEIPFEAHKRYWDLQLVLEGEELLGYAPLAELTETVAYAEKDDIAFYRGEGAEREALARSGGAACAVGRPPSGGECWGHAM